MAVLIIPVAILLASSTFALMLITEYAGALMLFVTMFRGLALIVNFPSHLEELYIPFSP